MKMILAIIQADDANAVLRGLAASQIRATRIATEGAGYVGQTPQF